MQLVSVAAVVGVVGSTATAVGATTPVPQAPGRSIILSHPCRMVWVISPWLLANISANEEKKRRSTILGW